MTWNLFIDDERFPPSDSREWVIARDGSDVIKHVLDLGMPSYISFDHDLGPDTGTGYDIAKLLVDIDMKTTEEMYRFPKDFGFYVHSQNPIGKQNIEQYLNGYLKSKL